MSRYTITEEIHLLFSQTPVWNPVHIQTWWLLSIQVFIILKL